MPNGLASGDNNQHSKTHMILDTGHIAATKTDAAGNTVRMSAIRLYGLGAIALGLVGLIWKDFALDWQPVPQNVPGRSALACLAAIAFLVAGSAAQSRRTARTGLVILAILYAACAMLHIPDIVAHPQVLAPWAGAAEQLAIWAAALMVLGAMSSTLNDRGARMQHTARIVFGCCLLGFGAVHFVYSAGTASFVPNWIPLGQVFWAYFTGVAQCAAGIAILSRHFEHQAAVLLSAMYIAFSLLVHIPLLLSHPHVHFNWAANALNLALIGSAWVIADVSRHGHAATVQVAGRE